MSPYTRIDQQDKKFTKEQKTPSLYCPHIGIKYVLILLFFLNVSNSYAIFLLAIDAKP